MGISERLKLFALKYGSQTDLATALDMKPQALQSYINGRSKPGTEILIKLHYLGCNIVWLLTGEETMQHDIVTAPVGAVLKNEDIISKGEYLKLQEENEKLSTTIDVLLSKLYDEKTYLQKNRDTNKTSTLKKVAEPRQKYNT